jgi:hypothetical protein
MSAQENHPGFAALAFAYHDLAMSNIYITKIQAGELARAHPRIQEAE